MWKRIIIFLEGVETSLRHPGVKPNIFFTEKAEHVRGSIPDGLILNEIPNEKLKINRLCWTSQSVNHSVTRNEWE